MNTALKNNLKAPVSETNSLGRLGLATQIMAGLLASGHYTERSPDLGDEEDPRPRRFDHGKDWEKDGVRRRRPCHAVDDAISLLKEMEEEVGAASPAAAPPLVPPGYQIDPEPQGREPVKTLVRGIDFPHLRDPAGKWLQTKREPFHEPEFSFRRACHYARQLRALGMSDADTACLLGDLYWDAANEMQLNRKVQAKS